MPQIRVKLGLNQGLVVPLESREIIVGRDPSSDLPLNHDSPASRRHASIFPTETGWSIRDLGSVNGTYVNGTSVTERALSVSDEITIGDAVFVFENGNGAVPETAIPSAQ